MNICLVIIAIAVAWAIGPIALQLAGAGLALITLLLLATGAPIGWATALVVGGGGAIMLYVGLQWNVARLARYPTPPGVLLRELSARLVLEGNPGGGRRRWVASRIARALGPIQVEGLLHDAQAAGRPSARPTRWWNTGAHRPGDRTRPTLTPNWRRTNHRSTVRDHRPRRRDGTGVDWIEGTARDAPESADTSAEHAPADRHELRLEVDRVLEQTRDCLERIIWALFVNTYHDWPDRLNAHRWQRRPDLAPIATGEGALHDRRLLFSVIAHDWTLIGSDFKRDPSPAARRLCAIANRYAHEGPLATDAVDARRAFAEILSSLRPHAIETAKGFMHHSRPLATR